VSPLQSCSTPSGTDPLLEMDVFVAARPIRRRRHPVPCEEPTTFCKNAKPMFQFRLTLYKGRKEKSTLRRNKKFSAHPTTTMVSVSGAVVQFLAALSVAAALVVPVVHGQTLGDWAFCSSSSQCQNGCCSSKYSNDGKLKCTPLSGGYRSDICVSSSSGGGGGGGGGASLYSGSGSGTFYYDITGRSCTGTPYAENGVRAREFSCLYSGKQ
jgi:hypothetical protein